MRKSRKYQRPVRPLNTQSIMGYTHTETGADGFEYKVHHIVSGKKQYLCPGCNGVVSIGESHEVVWTESGWFGVETGQANRRHWHTGCWHARGRAK